MKRRRIPINKERISGSQFTILLFLTIMATVILYVPNITGKVARQSAWLVPPVAAGVGFFTLWLISRLGKRFPRQTLVQYSTMILGKYLGKLVGGSYILFFFVFNVLIIRQFAEVIKLSFLERTPISFIIYSLILVASYGAILGLEVIARSAQFVLPLFIGSFTIIVFFTLQDLNFKELLPLFEGGLSPILKSSITPAAWFGESIILAFLLPNINKPKEALGKGVWAILFSIFALSADIILCLLVLGPELVESYNLPFWKLVRFLEVGRTFLRVETILIFLWISSVVVKLTIIHFLGSIVVAQVFGFRSHKKIVMIMGIALGFASVIFVSSTMELAHVLEVYWPPFAFFFELFLPSILLLTAWLRKVQGGKSS